MSTIAAAVLAADRIDNWIRRQVTPPFCFHSARYEEYSGFRPLQHRTDSWGYPNSLAEYAFVNDGARDQSQVSELVGEERPQCVSLRAKFWPPESCFSNAP